MHNQSLDNGAHVRRYQDNATPDHAWRIVDNGDGWLKIVNVRSGKLLAVDGMRSADAAQLPSGRTTARQPPVAVPVEPCLVRRPAVSVPPLPKVPLVLALIPLLLAAGQSRAPGTSAPQPTGAITIRTRPASV